MMEIIITKSDFERALPVGAAAGDNVYLSVKPAIEAQLDFTADALLGEEGMARVDALGDGSRLLLAYKQTVCLSAMLSVLRQLDLVLTPTGFGVVSNDNVAPASKQRVDALEAQLRTQYHRVLALTLNLLRSDAWGLTPQARFYIDHLYDEYTFFYKTHHGASSADWHQYQPTIEAAEETLRAKIGDALMDEMIDAFRRADAGRLGQYREIIDLVVKFTDAWAAKDVSTAHVYHRMMRMLDDEANADRFKLYRDSASYRANHYEPYKNTKDSAGYVFNG